MNSFFLRLVSAFLFCCLFLGCVMPAHATSADSLLRMAIAVTRNDDLNAYVKMLSPANEIMMKIAIANSPEADSIAIRRSRHDVLKSTGVFFMSNRNNWMRAFPTWKNIKVLSNKIECYDSTDQERGFEGVKIRNYKTETLVEDTVTKFRYMINSKMDVWNGELYLMEIRYVEPMSQADKEQAKGNATISSTTIDMTNEDQGSKPYIKYNYTGTVGGEKIVLTIQREINSHHTDVWYSHLNKSEHISLYPEVGRLAIINYIDIKKRAWIFIEPKSPDTKLKGYLIDDLTTEAFELEKE